MENDDCEETVKLMAREERNLDGIFVITSDKICEIWTSCLMVIGVRSGGVRTEK